MVQKPNAKDNTTPQEASINQSIAVALEYDSQKLNAPQILATGRGYLARRILETAREYNIPVEKDPVLAEALGQLDLGQEIPPELYKVVAEVLVFIMETDRNYKKIL
jgi:flagellar biosynthesis protein